MKRIFLGFLLGIIFFVLFIHFNGAKYVILLSHHLEKLGEKLIEASELIKRLLKQWGL